MPSFLLTWNPDRFAETEVADLAAKIQTDSSVVAAWSCGNTKRIIQDDRVFLIRLGAEPRGIFGSGWAISEPFEDDHWSGEEGATSRYIDIEWEWLQTTPLISRAELEQPPFAGAVWSPQGSGITIPPAQAFALEALWAERLQTGAPANPDEVADGEFRECATRMVVVNAYERRAAARRACIAHYGTACAVCDMSLASVYGKVAAGLIHVHHLVPISSIGKEYVIDPVADLRPVCPNCHAVLHRKDPPFSLAEGRAMIAENRRAAG